MHFFALLLWAAAALAVVGGLPQLGVAIVVVVLLNGAFAFVQEYRADRAAQALRDLVPHRVTVVRDGHRQQIDAVDLVVGDLVLLEAGDRLAADLRVLEVHGLRVDEATLTGESEPVAQGRRRLRLRRLLRGRGRGVGVGHGHRRRHAAGLHRHTSPGRSSGRRRRWPASCTASSGP